MASEEPNVEEFRVTFNPPLYLERQRWLLDILRREAVKSVRTAFRYHLVLVVHIDKIGSRYRLWRGFPSSVFDFTRSI